MISADFGPFPLTAKDGSLTPAAKIWLKDLVEEVMVAREERSVLVERIATLEARVTALEGA